jgi:hypothetical protein
VLCAVFVPMAFLTGVTGQFYKQFAVTIAISTVISAVQLADAVAGAGGALLQARGAAPDALSRSIERLFGWVFRPSTVSSGAAPIVTRAPCRACRARVAACSRVCGAARCHGARVPVGTAGLHPHPGQALPDRRASGCRKGRRSNVPMPRSRRWPKSR